MRKISGILLLVAILTWVSCSKSSDSGAGSNNPPAGSCSGTPGTRFTAVQNIIQANCVFSGCHTGPNAQNGINFTDNCTIVAQKDRIKARAVDQAGTSTQMPQPPRAALSTADRQKITEWISAGGRITD